MSTDLPFLPFARPDITEDEVQAAAQAIRSGWLTTGPNAASLEQEFAEFIGGGVTAIAVNSATAGLHLALEALGVGPGDEVLVPTWTFTATAEVVRYLGADPVFVDVDPVTLNMDLAAAEAAISPLTRAIMPVHFAGLAVPQSPLRGLADRHGLKVLEDAAHAIPAAVDGGAHVGSGHNEAAVFSFYATKTMTTGEGGMVTLTDEAMAARVRTMRLHGISRDVFNRYQSKTPAWHYEVVAPGFKYNLADPAAAIGRVQLSRAQGMGARRAAIAAAYNEAFRDLPLTLPAVATGNSRHAWHLYVVRLRETTLSRDSFIQAMADNGVGTSVHFIPLHLHPYWRDRYSLEARAFPHATEAFGRAVSLPIFSSMTTNDVERVIATVRSILT